MKQKQSIKDEIYIEAHGRLKTLSAVAHELQVPTVTAWRRCKKLGLTFKNGGQNKDKQIIRFDTSDILAGNHPTYPTLKLKKRLLEESILDNKCDECGITKWQNKEIVLQLDHIDGNCHNHKLNNLRMLCPNCHSQTDTWCGKNK
jgi:hypothetical protein